MLQLRQCTAKLVWCSMMDCWLCLCAPGQLVDQPATQLHMPIAFTCKAQPRSRLSSRKSMQLLMLMSTASCQLQWWSLSQEAQHAHQPNQHAP
jgi:hypothetical protein